MIGAACVALLAGLGVTGAVGSAQADAVLAQTCTATGAWATEDVAPVQTADGLNFAGPNALTVNYYHPLSGNLQGIVPSSITITKASGIQTSLVWEIFRDGTTGFATIVAEPYMNGWVAGQTGVFTVTQSTLVWTSKIDNPNPGSQAQPITLAAMGALSPTNTLISEGIHLGTNSTAEQFSVVSAVSGCVTANFVPQPTGTATPSTVTVTAFQATGVAVHLTGFVPGETVDGGFASTGSGGPTGLSYTADANGNVDFVFKTLVTPGTYTLSGFASVSGIVAFASVTVIADGTAGPVATPATPVAGNANFTG
jgi:hypothetical protein